MNSVNFNEKLTPGQTPGTLSGTQVERSGTPGARTYSSTKVPAPGDKSPFDLVQERLLAKVDERSGSQREREWAVAVACALLNRCHGRQVRGLDLRLLELWPGPEIMAAADPETLARNLRPLGFQNRRAAALIALSKDCAAQLPAEAWRGCGPYAIASIKAFTREDLSDDAGDPWVRRWIDWKKSGALRAF